MTVNGIELEEGQVWTTTSFGNVTLSKDGVSHEYPWRCISDECDFSITEDGKYWNDDKEPILLELIEETVITNKFNPKSEPTKLFLQKPGDKIVCNNGEEFICCTLEFLQENIVKFISSDKPILGYWKYKHNNIWQDWDEHGNASYDNDNDYNIREVIPQSSEVTDDKKEEVKEEPRYSMQEIKEAWDTSGWATATSSWGAFQKNLTKINSAEYQEYLRLKAIYE